MNSKFWIQRLDELWELRLRYSLLLNEYNIIKKSFNNKNELIIKYENEYNINKNIIINKIGKKYKNKLKDLHYKSDHEKKEIKIKFNIKKEKYLLIQNNLYKKINFFFDNTFNILNDWKVFYDIDDENIIYFYQFNDNIFMKENFYKFNFYIIIKIILVLSNVYNISVINKINYNINDNYFFIQILNSKIDRIYKFFHKNKFLIKEYNIFLFSIFDFLMKFDFKKNWFNLIKDLRINLKKIIKWSNKDDFITIESSDSFENLSDIDNDN